MQHWLKGISPASAPFSQTFEDLLRTNSGKKSGKKPEAAVAEVQTPERVAEISYTDPKANAAAEPSAAPVQGNAEVLQVLACCKLAMK